MNICDLNIVYVWKLTGYLGTPGTLKRHHKVDSMEWNEEDMDMSPNFFYSNPLLFPV